MTNEKTPPVDHVETQRLREALTRIAEATPRSTNSASASDAFAFCAAVANTALESQLPVDHVQEPKFGSHGSATAVFDVIAERLRQQEKEGFDASHDDMATRGQLALAGACYAYEATRTARQRADDIGSPPPMWPWDSEWWKPTDRRRDLVKAAALIIAEIERLDRATASEASE